MAAIRRKSRKWVRDHLVELGLALVATGWACGTSSPTEPTPATETPSKIADVAAKVAQAAAAVTGQTAQLADDYEKGHYVGFDTHTYPGTSTMRAWKNTPGAPYSWVGYYLPSPCHADKSWIGKRDTLASIGWGMAIVYVGQQTWGKTPRALSATQRTGIKQKTKCSTDLISIDEATATRMRRRPSRRRRVSRRDRWCSSTSNAWRRFLPQCAHTIAPGQRAC